MGLLVRRSSRFMIIYYPRDTNIPIKLIPNLFRSKKEVYDHINENFDINIYCIVDVKEIVGEVIRNYVSMYDMDDVSDFIEEIY